MTNSKMRGSVSISLWDSLDCEQPWRCLRPERKEYYSLRKIGGFAGRASKNHVKKKA